MSLLSDLREDKKSHSDDQVESKVWLDHFQELNTMKDKFSERIKNIESLLNDIESSTFQSELDKSITLSEIQRAVSKLKNNKAPGIDLICNEMIESSQNILGPCLLKLFNACLLSGTYPECWTDGYILPLYKGGELDNPSNYRGITITGAIGKLFN